MCRKYVLSLKNNLQERKKKSFISILERVRADADVSKGEGGGRGKMKWIRESNTFLSRIRHWTLIDQCICDLLVKGPNNPFKETLSRLLN